MRRSSRALFCRSNFSAPSSCAVRKIFSRWKHATAQKFLAAAMADLLRPVHPTGLAQAEKVPRIFIRRKPQVVEPEQHHARSPVRPVERRLSRQRKIRHPFIQPRTKIRPPQELPRVLPVQRRNAALRLQHLARAAVDFPTDVESEFWFNAQFCTVCCRYLRP